MQLLHTVLHVGMMYHMLLMALLKICRGTRNPEFPQTGPKTVRGWGTFLKIFSGRVGLGNFILGRGIFHGV